MQKMIPVETVPGMEGEESGNKGEWYRGGIQV
jgi:hypothetical protein